MSTQNKENTAACRIPAETRHPRDNRQPLIAQQPLPPSHATYISACMIYTGNKIRAVWERPTRKTVPSPHGEEKVALSVVLFAGYVGVFPLRVVSLFSFVLCHFHAYTYIIIVIFPLSGSLSLIIYSACHTPVAVSYRLIRRVQVGR